MKKRVILLALCGVMSMAVLNGCGSSENMESSEDTLSQEEPSGSETETADEEPTGMPPAVDT